MAWPALCLILTLFLCGLAGWCLLMGKQIRELQQWRHDITEICQQQIRSGDHA